ncbi:MAG: pilus assembly protein PilM [Phycisphaerales bacterium]|nr:MAG: pilus assembly protein PilM [Phycisphaerales bacterium]
MISWGIRTRGLRPIGLDIGHNSIKMLQLAINGEQVSVVAADEVRIDSGINPDEQVGRQFVVSAIKQMLVRGNFQGKKVVSCLPSGKLRITSLRLGQTEEEGIEQALKKEVVKRFGLDPERDAMDYVVAGSVRQGNDVRNELILFATDYETVKSHVRMLEQTGLKPVAIDTIPCALFRSFERSLRRQEDWDCTSVFVDVGCRCTTVVFGRGGEISFVKEIPIGGENFIEEVARRLSISTGEADILRNMLRVKNCKPASRAGVAKSGSDASDQKLDTSTQQVIVDAISSVAENLTKEISLCLRYYTVTFRGKHVQRAVFAGGGAYEEILIDVLRREMSINIEVAEPLKGIDMSSEGASIGFGDGRRGLLCKWAVVVGIGLKGWDKIKTNGNWAKKHLAVQS